ncbi:ABC transporter permease [Kitasatospora sp. GP82]|uniref:ABC transporter permease n=1 Tax=Kitasatospora sp. GP82 TaxID=3035089 RepID=UPI0024754A3A|nr:ABC transporter permease [Kitasatospora sp. GP82]MDH6123494.1 ABC-2 type transport system permease protein [Kitasatospora sp. GP82]
MSTASHTLRDTRTMFRRDTRLSLRNPMMTISGIISPIVMFLLLNYVFGGAVATGGRYVDYLVPGILVMAVGSGAATTAVNLSADVHEGIVARFRTMAIARSAILGGTVAGSVIRTLISLTLITGAALAVGFRPHGNALAWCGAAGLLALAAFALTWIAVGIGIIAKTAAGANSLTLPFQFLLPFLSSAFVSPATMPSGLRWFADNNPYTHIIDTLRGLLLGGPIGSHAAWAVGWSLAIALLGFAWARSAFEKA